MAEDKTSEAAKKQLADDKELRSKQEEQRKAKMGTPTPTQEEADLAKLGQHPEVAPDGSPPDPNVGFGTKQLEGERHSGGGYQTRQSTTHRSSASTPHSSHSASRAE